MLERIRSLLLHNQSHGTRQKTRIGKHAFWACGQRGENPKTMLLTQKHQLRLVPEFVNMVHLRRCQGTGHKTEASRLEQVMNHSEKPLWALQMFHKETADNTVGAI